MFSLRGWTQNVEIESEWNAYFETTHRQETAMNGAQTEWGEATCRLGTWLVLGCGVPKKTADVSAPLNRNAGAAAGMHWSECEDYPAIALAV